MTELFHRTMTALEQSLTCALIASDISPDGVMPDSSTDQEIITYALRHNFTRVPLWEDRPGEPSHIATVNLHEATLRARRAINTSDLIAGNTPIGRAIHLLHERNFCLILVNEKIHKILTRSDLNKLPVRVYLTAIMVHLEGLLSSTIVSLFPDDSWLDQLAPDRQELAKINFAKKQKNEFDTVLIDCTMLSDKAKIVAKSVELREQLQAPSKSKVDRHLTQFIRLRDRIAHGMPPLQDDADMLRNHLYHGDQLTRAADLKQLASIVETMQHWIDCLNQDPQEDQSNDT